MFRNKPNIAAFAATTALCLWGLVSGASGESSALADSQARYAPIQAITYEVGSKLMTGYFVEQGGICVVTLMIIEKSDPEELLAVSPTRVRVTLNPGEVVGFDSEEGRSLNFTCEAGAAMLLVDFGERDRLVALQEAALQNTFALQP